MKRTELRQKFSQVVGVEKAEDIIADAESVLGIGNKESYSAFDIREICEEIGASYDGYLGEIATEVRANAEAQQRFDTLLENVPDPAVVVTFVESKPIVKTVNSEFESVFGYSKASAIDQPLEELIVPDELSYGMEMWTGTNRGEEREVTRVTADGEHRTFLVRTAMETTMGGGVEGYAIYTDITERIERERELQTLKQLFSRVFRHNVRNELTVMQGHLSIIESTVTDETIAHSTQAALESTDRLLSHTEKTRAIEKLVDTKYERTAQSLQQLVEAGIEKQDAIPEAVSINTDVPDISVRVISGFETAVGNAIENAISHNPHPVAIEVTAEITEETAVVVITDNGIGISAGETKMLATEEESPLTHGSGIGLWVMYWYVRKSGGELQVTGTETGTTVRMTLRRVKEDSE